MHKKVLLWLIRLYQYFFSFLFGNCCRFYPSCSNYAMLAIQRFGVVRGTWLSCKRLLRCHPWCDGGEDCVPDL